MEIKEMKSNIVELDATKIGKAIITLYNDYEKLNKQKQDLIVWLKEEIKNANDKSNSISNLTNISYGSRSYALEEVLERLVGDGNE